MSFFREYLVLFTFETTSNDMSACLACIWNGTNDFRVYITQYHRVLCLLLKRSMDLDKYVVQISITYNNIAIYLRISFRVLLFYILRILCMLRIAMSMESLRRWMNVYGQQGFPYLSFHHFILFFLCDFHLHKEKMHFSKH